MKEFFHFTLNCRLEERHSTELQAYREESQRYRLESETVKHDLAMVQEELRQQMEAAQRGPSEVTQNFVAMLRAQLRDKEAKERQLLQTVADLQVWLSAQILFQVFYINVDDVINYRSSGFAIIFSEKGMVPIGSEFWRTPQLVWNRGREEIPCPYWELHPIASHFTDWALGHYYSSKNKNHCLIRTDLGLVEEERLYSSVMPLIEIDLFKVFRHTAPNTFIFIGTYILWYENIREAKMTVFCNVATRNFGELYCRMWLSPLIRR